MATMHEILATQRAAFMAELPVGLAMRKDRLKRAAAMLREHQDAFCDALSEDFGHRSREQSLLTDIAASISPINHAIKSLDRWSVAEKTNFDQELESAIDFLSHLAPIDNAERGPPGDVRPPLTFLSWPGQLSDDGIAAPWRSP